MKDEISGFDPLIAKKRRLSQWLFFVLLINIVLQLDIVENLISPSQQELEITLESRQICGLMTQVQKNSPSDDKVIYSIQQIASTSIETKVKLVTYFEALALFASYLHKFQCTFQNRLCVQPRSAVFSGLSPPVV